MVFSGQIVELDLRIVNLAPRSQAQGIPGITGSSRVYVLELSPHFHPVGCGVTIGGNSVSLLE